MDTGRQLLYGVSLGTAIGVALTMVASLTLLPALLHLLGLKVLTRRQRAAVRAGSYDRSAPAGPWYRWAGVLQRRPVALGVLAAVVLAVPAVPFFSLRLGAADQGTDPAGSTTSQGYDLIAAGFGPGYGFGLQLVVSGPGATDPAFLGRVADRVESVPDVAPGSVRTVPTGKGITLIGFTSISSPQDPRPRRW